MTATKETEFGSIPFDWSFINSTDYCEKVTDGTHDSPKQQLDGQYLVTSKHIRGRNIDFENAYLISEKDYKKINERSQVDQWDVIVSMIGEYCGFAYLERNENIQYAVKNVGIFKTKNQTKAIWLFYYIQSKIGQNILEGFRSGTSQPYISLGALRSLPILVPPSVEEQKAITSVLCSLDDKIDLLHRQNTTLEHMAETLFRQWFVEDAQDDWEQVTLGDVATVQNGYAFSSSDYVEFQEGFLEVFKMGHIQPGGGLRFNPKADFVPRIEKLKRWTLNKNDIVMAMTDMKDNMGILGHPALVDVSDKYVLNQRVARIYLVSTEKLKSIYLLYLQLNTEEAISLLQSKANSGVQVNLTTEAIKSIPVSLPPEPVQDKVLSNIEPIFDKLSSNRMAVKTLEKLRDNLLPKLMSGEIRIQNG